MWQSQVGDMRSGGLCFLYGERSDNTIGLLAGIFQRGGRIGDGGEKEE